MVKGVIVWLIGILLVDAVFIAVFVRFIEPIRTLRNLEKRLLRNIIVLRTMLSVKVAKLLIFAVGLTINSGVLTVKF